MTAAAKYLERPFNCVEFRVGVGAHAPNVGVVNSAANFAQIRFRKPAIFGMVLRIEVNIICRTGKTRKVDYLNCVGALYLVYIIVNKKGIANRNIHSKFLLHFSLQSFSDVLSEFNMPSGHFMNTRKEFLGVCTPCKKHLIDTVG